MVTYFVDNVTGNDSNAGTSPGSGNAWLTIAHALATISSGDIVYVKSGTIYAIGTGLTAATGNFNSVTRLIGYTATPGDGGRPTIRATAAIVGVTISATGLFHIENFVVDGNSTGTIGVSNTGTYANGIVNCVVQGWTAEGVMVRGATGGFKVISSEITGCAGSNGSIDADGPITVSGCNIHGNTSSGIYLAGSFGVTLNCLVYGNTGATSDGIRFDAGFPGAATGNTIHGNGRHGINLGTYNIKTGILNNVITSNGGYGISNPASGSLADPSIDYNAFRSNTSGAYSGMSAGPHDVALTGAPYTNAAGGDFSLNSTAGAGAACRAAGYPGAFPGGTTTGYRDIGAAQSAGGGGGSAATFSPIGCGFIKGI